MCRRCFCNHLYAKHQLKKLKNGRFGKNPCGGEDCKCDNFRFMWRRPEEIGQNFLVRRKGFDINQWRPLCGGCKHPHAVHDPVRTKCKECHCSKFISNFGLYIMKIDDKAGFIFVQHLRGFLGQLCYLENCFLSTPRQMPHDHKYSPLPSADFDSSGVLISFSAFIFS